MIRVDDRVGSRDLVKPLRAMGRKAELTRLPFADVAFAGNGPTSTRLRIGVEIKTLGDLCQSMTSRRLSGHQIPGLIAAYDVVVLVIEGLWKPTAEGGIVAYAHGGWRPIRARLSYSQIIGYVHTLEMRADVHAHRTMTRAETALLISTLYAWWNGKPWELHGAHLALESPLHRYRDSILLRAPDETQKAFAAYDNIGFHRSAAFAERFPNMRALCRAGVADIAAVKVPARRREGRAVRIGVKRATSLWRALRGKK